MEILTDKYYLHWKRVCGHALLMVEVENEYSNYGADEE
nr:hypothetical protein [Mucilaginibacter sp. FT3.2]